MPSYHIYASRKKVFQNDTLMKDFPRKFYLSNVAPSTTFELSTYSSYGSIYRMKIALIFDIGAITNQFVRIIKKLDLSDYFILHFSPSNMPGNQCKMKFCTSTSVQLCEIADSVDFDPIIKNINSPLIVMFQRYL